MTGIPKSKRSGGPKTEAGKSVASQNSLKTGIYSNVVVLPGEDESEYQQLENQFIKDFAPQDIAELTMVRELTVVVWKKHRLKKLELATSLKVLNQRIEDSDYQPYGLVFKVKTRYWAEHLEQFCDEWIELTKELLKDAQLFDGRKLSAEDMNSIMMNYPYLYSKILMQAERLNLFTEDTLNVDELIALNVENKNNELVQFVSDAVSEARSMAEDVLWVHANASKFKDATKTIQAERLLRVMEMEMPRRVNDDLSRMFFRTLSELRKHQQWRQAKNTVDVTPKATKIND